MERKLLLAAASLVLAPLGTHFPGMKTSTNDLDGRRHSWEPEQPCKHCGKLKRHKNQFCSKECCEADRKGLPKPLTKPMNQFVV